MVSVLLRALLLGVVWVVLAGPSADYALYGVVSVAAGTVLSLVLLPPRGGPELSRWPARVWGSLVLAGWFLWQSARGGVDVARRAARRVPDIEPAVVSVGVALPEGGARQAALLMMNLMPGTMVQRGPFVAEHGEVIELHTLSVSLEPAAQWEALQRRVARAAG
ncbi:Na+/H+ antiporter subunit E [Nesterenkonia populi]|uniref:Na+/H+ antiporter subunit E n=1 Tax=Nesterenkonia populi TaxID=1591087 RepID=UPI0014790829|nr:Na+/H+ antiporter subunit E [Nesterenkonia populi]